MRRLLPAFALVLLVVLATAPLLLARTSDEVGPLARAAISAVALNANHFFLAQAGDYFGPTAETNALLHLWSLSVEEQFYLIWPLALVLLLPRVRSLAGPIAALAFASLCLALVMTPHAPAAAFFTMPPRAWELLGGAFIAVAPLSWSVFGWLRPALLVFLGLILLVLATLFTDSDSGFPAPGAILPVAGAVLILLGGKLDSSNAASKLLGAGWMTYLGRISYPWYLWHWPLLVFARSRRLYEADPAMDSLMVLLSLVLAIVTYEFLEKPLQRKLLPSRRLLWQAFAVSAVLAVNALTLGMWLRYGWAYSPLERKLDIVRKDVPSNDCLFSKAIEMDSKVALDCAQLGVESATPRIVLLGDSHANHWRPAIEKAVSIQGGLLGELTMARCAPLSQSSPEEHCVRFNQDVRKLLVEMNSQGHLAGVVVSARWPEATGAVVPSVSDRAANQGQWYSDSGAVSHEQRLEGFARSFKDLVVWLEENEIPVVVVMPSPVLQFVAPHCLALRPEGDCGISRERTESYVRPAEEIIHNVANSGYESLRLLDPKDFLCNEQGCPAVIDGVVVYRDDDHITETFSAYSARHFEEKIRWMYAMSSTRRMAASE